VTPEMNAKPFACASVGPEFTGRSTAGRPARQEIAELDADAV